MLKRLSLGPQLFLRIVPTIVMTILLSSGIALFSASKDINSDYDEQLMTSANVLWMLFRDPLTGKSPLPEAEEHGQYQGSLIDLSDNDYAEGRMFRIWRGGHLLFYSDTALPESIPPRRAGFSNVHSKSGEPWRIFHVDIPGADAAIEVGEEKELRRGLASDIARDLSWPLLVLFPLIAALIWFGISSGLAGIRALIVQIGSRTSDDLAIVESESLPRDIMPLVASLNVFLQKLDRSFAAEKRFAEHAAHQLRTPLTVLDLQLQMLSQADDAAERQLLTDQLLLSVRRATHLINQLLTVARVSYQPIESVDLSLQALAASVTRDFATPASQKSIALSLRAAESDCRVKADETLLRLILSNLIENALKYTPDHGEVVVACEAVGPSVRLSITDNGPGIAESERERVFHRFYRIDSPQVEGSGLGLSLVGEAVERLSGQVRLETSPEGKGLRVVVALPMA